MRHFRGYAGNILRVNLTTGRTEQVPTEKYSDLFLADGASQPGYTGKKSLRQPIPLTRTID